MLADKISEDNVKNTKNKKTVYIKTFGCSLNQSDSEVMAGLLEDNGYRIISGYSGENNSKNSNNTDKIDSELNNVDAVIINSCSVKNLAEGKLFKELRRWRDRKNGKEVRIVVAGCVPQAEPSLLKDRLKDVSVIGTRQIVHIVDILGDAFKGIITHNIDNDKNERLNLPKLRKSGIIEILPISEGCLSNCTYCKTKLARGNLLSYPKEKIVEQFKKALAEGCKEFWITSQDNGCYGFDIYRKEKYFLPRLLNDLLAIEGDFKIRLGMSNPDHVDRIREDLVKTFRHPKMFKFLHIPVQSGNNDVLKKMKRAYTVEEFSNIIDLFRKEIPEITISTDIIVGFPEETDTEFMDSMLLLRDIRFDVLNLSRFWLRKGTEAENMKQLTGTVIKNRCERMKNLFDKISENNNKKWLGKTCNVLLNEYGKRGSINGKNDYYKQIVIKDSDANKNLHLGMFVKVRIVSTTRYDLIGEVV